MKRTTLFVLPVLFLSSCAGHKLTQYDVEIANAQARMVESCYKSKQAQAPQYSDVKDQALLVAVEALAGKADRCADLVKTNAYDTINHVADAQNQALAQVVGSAVTGGIAVTGIVAGANVMKQALKSAGDKVTMVGKGHTHGSGKDNSPISGANMSTTTTTITEAPKEAP